MTDLQVEPNTSCKVNARCTPLRTCARAPPMQAADELDAPTPRVTLCMINYNGAQHLKRSLPAVRAQPWKFVEVLLVDNASEDDSIAIALELYSRLRIVRLPYNLGPGAARNAGSMHKGMPPSSAAALPR